MSFIGTTATFSVRGFGGLGSYAGPVLIADVYIGYGTSGNKIFDIAYDSSNNLIGSYGIDTYFAGDYLFKFTPNMAELFWYDSPSYSTITPTSTSILGGGCGTPSLGGTGEFYEFTNSSTYWTSRISYGSGGSSIPKFDNVQYDSSYIYGFVVGEMTRFVQISRSGSTMVNMFQMQYNPGFPPIIPASGQYFNMMSGRYMVITGLHGYGIGQCSTTYQTGNYKNITSGNTIQKIVSKNSYCYVAYTNSNSVGIARIDSVGNVANNVTYTVSGTTFNITGFDVDVTNNYIFLTYNNGTEDRIAKFNISGTLQWTRTLTSSSGSLLGITKIIASPNGESFAISAGNVLFQFNADGSISTPGSYTANGITYTYSEGTQWVSGSSNLLTLGSTVYSWTFSPTTSPHLTALTTAYTPSTNLLTWNGF